jgi:RHS repeat-associated protein
LKYNFSLGVSDNGNVMGITNNRDTTRSQNFAYDTLNRIATANTQATTGTNAWGLQFGYDVWANLLSATVTQGSAPMLSQAAGGNNRIVGFCYDAAGNLLAQSAPPCPSPTYAYNGENQMTSTAGVTYTYDGEGKRVKKSSGALYWYGMGSDALNETDLSGNLANEYIFFGGKRIARRDSSSNVFYYFADHLGTSREIVQAGQTTPCYDADFYPFGGERIVTNTCPQNYKFTAKERDAESGLDNFTARYFGSSLGRFMIPDPSHVGGDVVDEENPQAWNMYSYVLDNPLNATDPDGLDCVYTQGIEQTGGVIVERGNCTQDGGTYVNGTIDTNSLTYDPQSNELGYSFTNAEDQTAGAGTIALPPPPSSTGQLPPGIADMLIQAGNMSDAGVKAAMVLTAPEWLAAAGSLALVELAGPGVTSLIAPSEGQVGHVGRILAQSGRRGLEKSIGSWQQSLAKHLAKLEQYRSAGTPTSDIVRTINNLKGLIQAAQNLLGK